MKIDFIRLWVVGIYKKGPPIWGTFNYKDIKWSIL